MIHIIYLSIILLLLYTVIKAYDFANRKNKEQIKTKERLFTPHNILSHYENAYAQFYRWMTRNNTSNKIVQKYEELFKYED